MSGRQKRASRQSRRETDAQIQIHKAHAIGDVISKVGGGIVKWGALILIVKFGVRDPIIALAGKATLADIKVSGIGDFISQLISGGNFLTIILGFIIIKLYFMYHRSERLRKDVIEKYHPQQKYREEQIDPGRSSSSLTARGETRQEDL